MEECGFLHLHSSAQSSQSVCLTTGLQLWLVTLKRGTSVNLPNTVVNSEFLAEGAGFSHHIHDVNNVGVSVKRHQIQKINKHKQKLCGQDCQSTSQSHSHYNQFFILSPDVGLHSGVCRTVTKPVNVSVVIVIGIISCTLYFKDIFANPKYNQRSKTGIKTEHPDYPRVVINVIKTSKCADFEWISGTGGHLVGEQKLRPPPELRLCSNFPGRKPEFLLSPSQQVFARWTDHHPSC